MIEEQKDITYPIVIDGAFVLEEDPTFKVNYQYVITDEDSVSDLYFYHVLTNHKTEILDNVFSGWSEQNEEVQKKWILLQDRIDVFLSLDEFDDWFDPKTPIIVLGPEGHIILKGEDK